MSHEFQKKYALSEKWGTIVELCLNLSDFVGSNNIRIGFDGYTSSYDELLMLDNRKIGGQSSAGS